MNHPDVPRPLAVSVVVVRFVGGEGIVSTLDALAPQVAEQKGEVIVVHRPADAPTPAICARHPGVRWIAAEDHASPARLRTLGVRAAHGAIVACTEDHCTPAPDWCARVLAAHASGSAVVGGAIDKAPTGDGAAWAAYLLDYARYMSPLPAGRAEYVSDCNVSYRRQHLDDVTESWREEFHETTVHWALRARGVALQLEPTIVVRQHRDIELEAYLLERREHGQTFAHTRIANASPLARVRFAITALLLPWVIVLRVKRLLAERGAAAQVPASAWTPLRRAAVAWSRGELRGYLPGR